MSFTPHYLLSYVASQTLHRRYYSSCSIVKPSTSCRIDHDEMKMENFNFHFDSVSPRSHRVSLVERLQAERTSYLQRPSLWD
jgi:hypothetical protein